MRRRRLSVRHTGNATAGPGGIANTGIMFVTPRSLARSAYRYQVAQLFPWELVGREEELAELAAFSTAEAGAAYAYWQGPAWAGKSALMAWFVLHPPPGVRVVSFFITARYAGQSDRNAFLDVVLEQLAEAAGQPMPDPLTEPLRQGHFGRLLAEATQACHRLVLVVDGLDEDRGNSTNPDAHSIAALLPADPPPGLKVIVSGRPDPPVPSDVPRGHPLRDPAIVRQLAVSPQAGVIRDDAERELAALLDGGGPEHDLLGLVTSAGGGLGSADLAELTDLPERVVVRHLRAVSGRTFRRLGEPDMAAYALAHEELQRAAVDGLGERELAGYRGRLHAWADAYRQRGWPEGTPRYLLYGYPRLLHDLGDVSRLVDCVTNPARLDRLYGTAGGDAAALSELSLAEGLLERQELPDLAAMLDLVATRAWLGRRSEVIPAGLPAAWACLGDVDRAESLARSLVASPTWRHNAERAVAELVEALVAGGDLTRADAFVRSVAVAPLEALAGLTSAWLAQRRADRAEDLARAVAGTIPSLPPAVVGQLVGAGEVDRAERLLESMDPAERARPMITVIRARAASGDADRAALLARQAAEITTRPIPDSPDLAAFRVELLAGLAGALAVAGDHDRARRLAGEVEESVASLPQPTRVTALIALAEAWAGLGSRRRARQMFQRAEVAAHAQARLPIDIELTVTQARMFVAAGEPRRARPLVRKAERELALPPSPGGHYPPQTQLVVAGGLASVGEWDRAEDLVHALGADAREDGLLTLADAAAQAADAERTERYVADLTDPAQREEIQLDLTESLVAAGDVEGAERAAWSIAGAGTRIATVFGLVPAMASADPQRARRAAERAENELASADEPYSSAVMQALRARAWAVLGDHDRARQAAAEAEGLADGSADLEVSADALTALVAVSHQLGDPDCAAEATRRARTAVLALAEPRDRDAARAQLAEVLADAGEPRQAREVVAEMEDGETLATALTRLVEISEDQTGTLAEQVETLARSITDAEDQLESLVQLADIWSAAGDLPRGYEYAQRAEQMIAGNPAVDPDARALAELIRIRMSLGQADRARELAEQAEAAPGAYDDPGFTWWRRCSAARGWLAAGDLDRAEAVAATMTGSGLAPTAITSDGTRWVDPRAVVVTHLLARGLVDRAEAVVPDLSPGLESTGLLVKLIRARLAAGDLDRAQVLLRRLPANAVGAKTVAAVSFSEPDASAYAKTAAEVIRARIAAGDAEAARTLAEEVDALVRALPAASRRIPPAFCEVAAMWSAAGDRERGRRLARRVESSIEPPYNESWQGETLTRLAFALAGVTALDEAETIARLAEPQWRINALVSVALGRAESGDTAAARRLASELEELIATAGTVDEADWRPVQRLAATFAVLGDPDRSWTAVRGLPEPYEQMDAAISVVLRLKKPDDFRRAEAAIGRIKRAFRQPALAALASAMADAGDFAGAESLAGTLSETGLTVKALCLLALARHRAGEHQQARDLIAEAAALAPTIVDWETRGFALEEVVAGWIGTGDLHRAAAVAESIDEPVTRARALAELAKAGAAGGDRNAARQQAGRIEELAGSLRGRQAGNAVGSAAVAWAAAGDPEKADALARSIDDSDTRSAALVESAKIVHPGAARRLLMTALATAYDYRTLLPAIAATDREALTFTSDRLARWGLPTSPSA